MLESQSSLMQDQWRKIFASKGERKPAKTEAFFFCSLYRPLAEGVAWIIGGSSQRSRLKACVPSSEIQNRSGFSHFEPLFLEPLSRVSSCFKASTQMLMYKQTLC